MILLDNCPIKNMEVELKKYLELGPQMKFTYTPFIPFCIFIT